MDDFSTLIFRDLIKRFPECEQYCNRNAEHLIVDIPSPTKANIGGIVIQTTADKDIWIRTYHGYSAYNVDDSEELEMIITEVLSDRILWVIGMRNEQWVETTLVNHLDQLETDKGVTYKVLSWSGKQDKIFTAK